MFGELDVVEGEPVFVIGVVKVGCLSTRDVIDPNLCYCIG